MWLNFAVQFSVPAVTWIFTATATVLLIWWRTVRWNCRSVHVSFQVLLYWSEVLVTYITTCVAFLHSVHSRACPQLNSLEKQNIYTPTYAHKLYKISKYSINMNSPTCFSNKSQSSGRRQYKGIYTVTSSNFYIHVVKNTFFCMTQQPLVGQGHSLSRLHDQLRHTTLGSIPLDE
jgi:hypothetical protein